MFMRDVEASLWYLSHFTADEIADLFRREGIKGSHGAAKCPVSNYLKRETDIRYSVFRSARQYDEEQHCERVERESYEVPSSAFIFIQRFDAGQYPDLEEEEARLPVWSL